MQRNAGASSSTDNECTDPDSSPTENLPISTYEVDFREAYLTQENLLFSNTVDVFFFNDDHNEN